MPPGMAGQKSSTVADADAARLADSLRQAVILEGERVVLSNGIEALLLPDPTSRLVTSIAVVRAGSAWEDTRTSGASHFLEHMLFNGTRRRTQQELYDETDRFGGFNNAFTRRGHTAFMMTMPRRYLGRALDLQADMLFHSAFPPEKFEKERGIILEELAKDRESEAYGLERVLETAIYPQTGYGLPVLGNAASIARLSRDEVFSFYRANYVPERMHLVLLGGFDPAAAIDSLEATFGAEPPAGGWFEPPRAPRAIQGVRCVRHRLERSRSHLRIVWNTPPVAAPDPIAWEAAAALLAGDETAPWARVVRARFPSAIQSWSGRLETGEGFQRLILDLEIAPGTDLAAVRDTILAVREEAGQVPAASVEAWKVGRLADLLFARQRSYMFAPLYAEEVALHGTWGLQSLPARIRALEPERVGQLLPALGLGAHVAVLVDAIPMAGQAPSPAPASPLEEVDALPYAVHDTLLASGARVLLLETPPSGVLAIYVLIEGRNYVEPEGREGITELLQILMGRATRERDEQAFGQALRAVGGELQTADRAFLPFDDRYTQPEFSFIRFQALEEHAAEAFALLGEMLKSPRLGSAELERARGELQMRVAREAHSGAAVARQRLRELLYGAGHPEARSPYGTPASLAAITGEELETYHRRLIDPRRIWVAAASALDPAEVLRQVAAALPGEAPPAEHAATLGLTPERFALWQTRGSEVPGLAERWAAAGGRLELELGGERGYALEAVLLRPQEGAAEAPSPTLDEGVWHTAVGLLSNQLAFELREERGLAYGIGARISRLGEHWLYTAAAGTRQENIEAMEAGLTAGRCAVREAGAEEAIRREAHARYGTLLRRQENRVNQAMAAVWGARAQGNALRWWSAAEATRTVSAEAVRAALTRLATAETTLRIVVR